MHTLIAAHPLAALSPLEVHKLYKLRVDIFVHEQRCPYAEIDDVDADPDTVHLLAWDVAGRQLLGTARVFPDGARLRLGRVCVTPSARGTGLSGQLVEAATGLAEGRDVVLDAQVPLVEFYRGFGFEPVGDVFDDEGIPHQPMLRVAASEA